MILIHSLPQSLGLMKYGSVGPSWVTPCSCSVCDSCTLSDAFDASKSTHMNVTVLGGAVVNNLLADVGDRALSLHQGESPGGGNGNPLQYSCLESPMDRGAWWATVYGVAKVKHDDDWAHNRYEAASHWGFDLHLPSDNNVENIFISILAICRFSLEKWPFKSSMHF